MNQASRITRRTALAALAASALAARAQSYPSRPIEFVVPYPAGSASDVLNRQYANELAKVLKVPIVVLNKAGAGGLIGTKFVATAPPDGYTMLAGAIGTHVFNPAINSATPYDPIKDFVPVSRTVSIPNVVVVRPSLGVNSVAELVALAKSSTNPLSYGTGGNGTTSHIAAGQFAALNAAKLLQVNFQGTPSAVNELLVSCPTDT